MAGEKILVADDAPTVISMVKFILEEDGYQVTTASDGVEAIDKVYREKPDLVLLDILMPKINGYQVCRLLKDDKKTHHIPVIMLTGQDQPKDKFWGLQTGADDYIIKGFQPEELLRSMEKLLKEASLRAQPPTSHAVGRERPKTVEDILSQVSRLLDRKLYESTTERIKLQTILQSMAEGVFTIDRDKKITAFNPAAQEITRLKEEDVIGKECLQLIRSDICQRGCLFEKALSQDSDILNVEMNIQREGRIVPLLVSLSLLRDDAGKVVGAVVVFRDISKLKELEQMKADFVYMVVQELRNPLTSARESVSLLLDGVTGEINAEQEEFLSIINKDTERLIKLSDNILKFSELDLSRTRLHLEEIDFGSIAEETISATRPLAEGKGVELLYHIGGDLPGVLADGDKVKTVLLNLLSNAVKFTPKGGRITVEAEIREGTFLQVSVTDTGVGISLEKQEKLFDRLQAVDARERESTEAIGLGLAIAKAMVEAHKGEIWVKSSPGTGSTFYFTLPLKV